MTDPASMLHDALARRFGEEIAVPPGTDGLDELFRIASHVSHRKWSETRVSADLLRLLAACALSAPSKSDLQQAHIIEVRDESQRDAVAQLLPTMPWTRSAPVFLVFCGNGRRLRRVFTRRGLPFPNEHLDGFFNPAVDAALVMMNFMRAASATGLVHCPISVLRDQADRLSDILALPDHVFPVTGLCVGYPAESLSVNPRFALSASLHTDRFDDSRIDAQIDDYDRRWEQARSARAGPQAPAPATPCPSWSDEKAKQFSTPQSPNWGKFVRSKGFDLS